LFNTNNFRLSFLGLGGLAVGASWALFFCCMSLLYRSILMHEVVFCVFVRSVTRNLINSIQSSTTHYLNDLEYDVMHTGMIFA